jgi:NAD(P)-dependent dehydrogenase (short-subunit alcohol dehydrogenase family)
MSDMFDISGKVVAVTGGGGVLCSCMAKAAAKRGARVAVLDYAAAAAEKAAREIRDAGGAAVAVQCNVLEPAGVQAALDRVRKEFGEPDVLVNGAGGNNPKATANADQKFFDLPQEAFTQVFALNIMGTVIPSQAFGRAMAARGEGHIINVSSMNAFRPLTNIVAYSAAKAAVSNFTMWLAVHMAQNYSKKIRVNAIAPGFFLTDQNRFLLTDKASGELTPRGKTILGHTPMGRFGEPEDLVGALLWLMSPASAFVTGAVIPIDGGFNAFAGV